MQGGFRERWSDGILEFENIIYNKGNEIAHVVINRPEKRNALNRAARIEMMSALDDAEKDIGIKVLILSGAGGKSFMAGSDLNDLSKFSPLDMEAFTSTLGGGFYTRFEQSPKPVIAMIDGLCLGGGLELWPWQVISGSRPRHLDSDSLRCSWASCRGAVRPKDSPASWAWAKPRS